MKNRPIVEISRLFLFCLALSLSSCSPVDTESRETWSLTLVTSGGLAGITRELEIDSNGQATVIDDGSGQPVSGELPDELQSEVAAYVLDAGTSKPNPPAGCADCFAYSLEIRRQDGVYLYTLTDLDLDGSGISPLVMLLNDLQARLLSGEFSH